MTDTPRGKITIQTLAMPADTNPSGDIFGGWLVSQMDLAAGVLEKEVSTGRVATIAIQSVTFLKPVHVGDLISCYVDLEKRGHSSMTIHVEAWTERLCTLEKFRVTNGTFVFVAIDKEGKPRPINS